MPNCPVRGCDYEAKTAGAITQHVNRAHQNDQDDVLAKIRAAVPGAPRPGGAWRTDKPLVAAPSGVPSVDYAIGIGGVPRGTLIEVFGPPKGGKTFLALTFSAYAQAQGQLAGFMDAERALQPTFLQLIPNLNVDDLYYGMPPDDKPADGWDGSGEAALESSRRSIATGQFAVWTIDSVHACTPRSMMNLPIGHPQTSAALAQLMNQACQVMEKDISNTSTTAIFINHQKAKPQAKFGVDWSKPGGSAFDYYCAVQLQVTAGKSFYRKGDNMRIGHEVKVRVHKSKVAQPYGKATFDLYYGAGVVAAKDGRPEREVQPGIDALSCWFGVLKESDRIRWVGSKYVEIDSNGEVGNDVGSELDAREALADTGSNLYRYAHDVVYPPAFRQAA